MLRSIMILALVGFTAVGVRAADDPANADQIQQWVEQLDSHKFAEREDATTKLIAAGHATAMKAVERIVESGGPEARTRATHVLAMWHRSSDSAARQVVQAAATRWQMSEDPRMARLGKTIVTKPAVAAYPLYQTGNLWSSGVVFGGAGPWGMDPVTAAGLRSR